MKGRDYGDFTSIFPQPARASRATKATTKRPSTKKRLAALKERSGKLRARAAKELRSTQTALFLERYNKGKKLKIAVTGTLPMTRSAFELMMSAAKIGSVQGHITKDTDFLIIGKDPGEAKREKAKKYGVKVRRWSTFNKMLKDSGITLIT